tara:strand:+ start:4115 stop:5263 length:1149 start_codon:yes stop_codon:yes gene_type:complete
MPYYEFKDNDIFVNTIELNPQFNFWIYGSKAYYNNLDQSVGNSNTPAGNINLHELNVNRATDNLIYPFLPKGSSLEAFKGISSDTYVSLDMGSLLTGSYPLTATITTEVYNTDAARPQIDALKNTLNYYVYKSSHYNFSSSMGDKATQRLTLIDFPSIFYGSGLKKGSIELSFYITGSLIGKLTDKNRNGELLQSSGTHPYHEDWVGGVVLYNEGLIVLTGSWDISEGPSTPTNAKYVSDGGSTIAPRWNAFARKTEATNNASYQIKAEGVNNVNVITMLAHAPAGELNYSPNPTYIEYQNNNEYIDNLSTSSFSFEETSRLLANTVSSSFSGYDAEFRKQTFISKIGIFDKNKNLIGIAKVATAVRKRENDNYTFKLKLDY